MNQFLAKYFAVVILGLVFVPTNVQAELKSDARYFVGQVKVVSAEPSECYVEVVYSPDANQVTTRAVMALQHLSSSGGYQILALGPYTANYLAARSLYRYQDTTVAAPVKDSVLNVVNQSTPVKYGVMYWHKEFGHHDPVFCEDLVEATSADQLLVIDNQFSNFEEQQANNP